MATEGLLPPGGRGQCSLADLMDPHRARGTAGLLAAAIRAGYIDAFCIDYKALKAKATELSNHEHPRIKASALKLLTAMALHDLKLAEVLDKAERLDAGKPTENVGGTIRYIKGVDEEAL